MLHAFWCFMNAIYYTICVVLIYKKHTNYGTESGDNICNVSVLHIVSKTGPLWTAVLAR